jgi:gamma-butyrobetaine dioxygenase
MGLQLRVVDGVSLVVDGLAESPVEVHPIWLRERNRDPRLLDLRSMQRLYDPADLPLDLAFRQVAIEGDGTIRAAFSDGVEAAFDPAPLLRELGWAPGHDDLPVPRPWDASLNAYPTAQWNAAPTDAERLDWTTKFLTYGFLILSGVPSEPGQVLKVGRAFGIVRETNFGDLFNVRSEPEANDLAYTTVELGAHTDNPYRTPVPGVQLLHCLINQTTGGLSTLFDGLSAAQALQAEDPEAYRILSTTETRYRFEDVDAELMAARPMIELDRQGRFLAVHVSPRLDFVPLAPRADLDAFYRARQVFDAMLRGKRFEIEFLLNDGDLVIFDNQRLMHGRTSFDAAEGLRHLQGCYIDIDGPRSLYRVLTRPARQF